MKGLIGAASAVAISSLLIAGERLSTPQQQASIPAGETEVQARLAASPRHGEWVSIRSGADSLRMWVVYPQRSTNAPVVVVIHEIYGLTPWVRGVADQLAADGYIAIAPDLLTMKNLAGTPQDGPTAGDAQAAIRTLTMDDAHRYLAAAAQYGMSQPSAQKKYAVIGFCWGGGVSFEHAARVPTLGAAVVFYGTPPTSLSPVRAPVMGFYGGNDNRVSATVPGTDSAMKALGKSYESHIFPGAAHGFARAQTDPANATAIKTAWPIAIAFLRKNLGQ